MKLKTKLLVGSALITALGVGTLAYEGSSEARYNDYIARQGRVNPIVIQVDSLDNAVDSLQDAQKTLTTYCEKTVTYISSGKTRIISPTSYHNPDVKDAMKELDFAKDYISQGNFPEDNAEIKAIDDLVSDAHDRLSKIPEKKDESFYAPERAFISDIENKAATELKRLETYVPTQVLEKREYLKNCPEALGIVGWVLSIMGGFGLIAYGAGKATKIF